MTNNQELADSLLGAERVLFVGAHPDDIEFYCGGLVYMLRRAGVEVRYLIATKGGRGRKGKARERLERLRVGHQRDAADVLGGAVVEVMDIPDGELAEYRWILADAVRARVEQIRPGFVFCWEYDGIYNPHPDHRAAAEACREALGGAEVRVICYGTRRPDLGLGLDKEALEAKMMSLWAHRTETPWYYWPVVCMAVRARLRRGGRLIGCRFAEVFRANP